MEPPALQNLLNRVRESRIGAIVVYKVDRMTRSLADFAKLVEAFDAHGVAFVSVTRSFNTTTSMGRLTLNVLLSFAQFEHEVTGERVRDKIAASKTKRLWMGGVAPLGYRVEDRKPHVDKEEAAIVRLIFDLYLELELVCALQRELQRQDVRNRVRTLATGRTIGRVHLTNGPLAQILRNRHYLGEINHRGQSWLGEYAAIIDAETFAKVQAKLDGQRVARAARLKSNAPLLGKLVNETGERLTPSYAIKQGVRYRYCISTSAMQARDRFAFSTHSVPAPAFVTLIGRDCQNRTGLRKAESNISWKRIFEVSDRAAQSALETGISDLRSSLSSAADCKPRLCGYNPARRKTLQNQRLGWWSQTESNRRPLQCH